MSERNEKPINQILDLLLDALKERQTERAEADSLIDEQQVEPLETNRVTIDTFDGPMEFDTEQSQPEPERSPERNPPIAGLGLENNDSPPQIDGEVDDENEESEAVAEDTVNGDDFFDFEMGRLPAEKLPSINMNKIFYRLSMSLTILIILVNIPFTFNQYRTTLATAMPDKRSLLIRNGLVFKGPGDEIYFLDEGRKRWISSLDAFTLNGLTWEQVHLVDQAFVDQFKNGPDYHVLIRCNAQPHIYLLEGAEKRWIQNPFEFEKAGFKWEHVRYISCFKLKNDYPDGVPIPTDAGEPPSW